MLKKMFTSVQDNHWLMIRELDEFSISSDQFETFFTVALGMGSVAAKLIPKLLIDEQKEHWKLITLDFLECAKSDENF